MRIEKIGAATDRVTAIYALCEPDMTPRYVGKTVRYLHERHKSHIRDARRNPRLPVHRWLAKRVRENQRLVISLIEYVPPSADWAARERHWINEYRAQGFDLLNLTEGGEGLAGHTFTQAHREKIAAAIRTGAHCKCETCGADFWRKRNEITKGNSRFCSRQCYSASLAGVSRPVPATCTERGIEAAAKARRARTDCKRGHPLSGDNLFVTSGGWRGCKECRKIHKATYRGKANG